MGEKLSKWNPDCNSECTWQWWSGEVHDSGSHQTIDRYIGTQLGT